MEGRATEFSEAARVLGLTARRLGLRAPGFRSPPRLAAARSIRRWPDGTALVSVALRGRPFAAVLADMVEGVLAANRVPAAQAGRARSDLWASVTHLRRDAA